MIKRLWVVECQFEDRKWGICDFGSYPYSFTNFYNAHTAKGSIHRYLHRKENKVWTKKRFRVREYIQK